MSNPLPYTPCLQDRRRWLEAHGVDWTEAIFEPSAACVRRYGHKGRHRFRRDEEILLVAKGAEGGQ